MSRIVAQKMEIPTCGLEFQHLPLPGKRIWVTYGPNNRTEERGQCDDFEEITILILWETRHLTVWIIGSSRRTSTMAQSAKILTFSREVQDSSPCPKAECSDWKFFVVFSLSANIRSWLYVSHVKIGSLHIPFNYSFTNIPIFRLHVKLDVSSIVKCLSHEH